MALGVGWTFLAIPLALFATSIDATLGRIAIGIAAAPLVIMGVAMTAFVMFAPLFARDVRKRLVAIPVCFFIGYALGGLKIAIGYLGAVLVAWAAISVWHWMNGAANKVRLPS